MNIWITCISPDWDKDLHPHELEARLTSLKQRAELALPILDDDDVEAAIDEAATRLAAE